MKTLFLIFVLLIHSVSAWRFFGRGSGYNAFGGYTASQFYNGRLPYYNQPFYPRYQQPYINGPYSNSLLNFRPYQRNGFGYYGPGNYRFVGYGSRETQGFSPYDYFGNYGK
jgi:hypothetical protein